VHSSYVNENPGFTRGSNEKLEFLGDAVLGLTIAEKLYQDFTQFSEGEMTRLRAALVRRETLARMAKALKLGDYLYLGKGEEASGGRSKSSNLASALEAVIATISLDQGTTVTRDFILRLFDKELQKVVSRGAVADDKSRLQELIQARHQETPVYHLLEAQGPAHNQTFTIEVRVADTVLGRGSGRSKKMAETEAARSALARLLSDFTA
jgi:ribonuclease-3